MNCSNQNIGNFLYVIKNANYAQVFYKLCLECIQKGHTALLVSRKPVDLLTLITKMELTKEQLKRFIIMYFSCIDDVAKKLFELHDWMLQPHLVVLDLNAYLVDTDAEEVNDCVDLPEVKSPRNVLQLLCLSIAALFDYMRSAERKRQLQKSVVVQQNPVATVMAHSVVLLGTLGDVLTQAQLELLINLYFYNEDAFDDFKEIKSRIVSTWD